MTALDTRARATAERLIATYGKTMVINRAAVGAYDPTTGTSTETPTAYTVKGVVSQPSESQFNSGFALAGDIKVLLAASALEIIPTPGDELVFDGVTWQVVAAPAIYSGEQVAIYEVLART